MADAPTGVAVSVDPDGRQPPITMQLSEGRVCANSEISTLLFYLRDRLIYRFGVFHMERGTLACITKTAGTSRRRQGTSIKRIW